MAVFQARARTVDMLGHQQVTAIATAISELFKNAHDAYARNVDVDYIRSQDLFIIRDNGVGMSPETFEHRWLTLAADDAAARTDAPKPPRGMKRRPIQGEKGIGRLAIATIGPQALVLTRPGGKGAFLTMALVNWRLFEVPRLNLDEIQIPLTHFPPDRQPAARDLLDLATQLRASIEDLDLPGKARQEISKDLDRLDFDPTRLLRELGGGQFAGSGHGSAFAITPTRGELLEDLEGIQAEVTPPPDLLKTLVGFSNTMIPDSGTERIKTAFRDHRSNDDVENIIDSHQFFTSDEFQSADHSVTGSFDEFGAFTGKISIYGASPKPLTWIWSKAHGDEVPFGPFKLSFAYIQGEQKSTRLEPKAYDAISKKLDALGGLYVYRDGIRILPYGDPSFDFLQFEERRSYNAGRYFFSYRRMFGAIELDSEHNGALREKAGREGFRNDRAYRQFTELLKGFFVQVAAEFFAKGGAQAEEFELGRQRVQERREQLAAREKEAEKRRKEFKKALGVAFKKIDDGHPARDVAALVRKFEKSIQAAEAAQRNSEQMLLSIETDAYRELDELRSGYQARPPAGFGLPRDLRRDWEGLVNANAVLEAEVWGPAALQLAELFASARRDTGAKPAHRDRLIDVIDSAATRQRERGEVAARSARESLGAFDNQVAATIDESRQILQKAADEASAAARNGGGPLKSDKELARRREAIENGLLSTTSVQLEQLESLAELLGHGLKGLGAAPDSGTSLSGMLEEEVLDLRDRAEQDFELAQVGMATQVISHELNATIQGVRSGLRRLSVWAEANEDLRPLYDDLRGSFDHLDGYLSLFTPLQRRLRRRREPLSGRRIEEFLVELFGQRLEKDNVTLDVTERFRDWKASGFRSTIYPVMVNLVDNASFWVMETDRASRWIKLDADGHDLLISDSGPGIPDRDRDAIWEFGFTRKPRGRGAGLHIAREVLEGEGWSITLEASKRSRGALFRVSPPA